MYHQYKNGFIEVITGCMFAGKTEELIRRINVLEYANQNIKVFKPLIDNRYDENKVVSHSGNSIESTLVSTAQDIYREIDEETDVVAIDEVQFFEGDIVALCDELATRGKRVMVAGLDKDFRGEPFGVMPHLMTTAEFVTKLTAVCTRCGAPATRSQRIIDGKPANYYDQIVLVGASESYEAVCRHCHVVPNKPQFSEEGLDGSNN